MRNIQDYLELDYELACLDPNLYQIRLRTCIEQVDRNPFAYPHWHSGVKHYRLKIYAEEKTDTNWVHVRSDGYLALPFYLSGYKLPTIEDFSSFIYYECYAALFANHSGDHFRVWDRKEIELSDVYIYIKLLHKDYSLTKDFIKDYNYWEDRMYNTQKWYHYLLGNLSGKYYWDRWRFPVGEKLYNFLSPFHFNGDMEAFRKQVLE